MDGRIITYYFKWMWLLIHAIISTLVETDYDGPHDIICPKHWRSTVKFTGSMTKISGTMVFFDLISVIHYKKGRRILPECRHLQSFPNRSVEEIWTNWHLSNFLMNIPVLICTCFMQRINRTNQHYSNSNILLTHKKVFTDLWVMTT